MTQIEIISTEKHELRQWFDESLDEGWREYIIRNEKFHWKCASPLHLAGKIFHELQDEDFVCHPETDAHYCHNKTLEKVLLELSVLDVTSNNNNNNNDNNNALLSDTGPLNIQQNIH